MSGPAYFTRSRAKMMLQEAKSPAQREVPLKAIPHQIVYKILFKIPCKELIRMRKTCRYVNTTVEKNKEAFSKRTDFGLGLRVRVEVRTENGSTDLYFGSHPIKKPSKKVSVDFPFQHHFSGVSIWKLNLYTGPRYIDDNGMLARFLERLKLPCSTLELSSDGPLRYLVQLADLVESRETDFSHWYLDGQGTPPLEILLSCRRRSTFIFTAPLPSYVLDELELIMIFKGIYASNWKLTAQQVCTLMKGLANLRNAGTLEFLSLRFQERNPFADKNFDFPPTKLLWKRCGLPKHLYREQMPDYIRKLDLVDGKCAIITKNPNTDGVGITFVKNTPEDILRILVKKLCIEEFELTDKTPYMEASEDRQIKMIREFYFKKHVAKTLN